MMLKPLTDEQVFYDKFFYDNFTLPSVRVYVQKFLMASFAYTAKNYELQQVVENRIEQCCAAHIVQCCQQYCSALLHLTAGYIQAQQLVQYC